MGQKQTVNILKTTPIKNKNGQAVPVPPNSPNTLHLHLFRFLPAAVFLHSPLSAICSSLDLAPLPLLPPPEAAASPISASICSNVLPWRSASISRFTLRKGDEEPEYLF